MNSPSYKQKLIECNSLREQAGNSAYQRGKLLVEVYNDGDFRIDNDGADDFMLAEMLNLYIEDLCLNFLQIRRMLEHFPKASQWKSGKLYSLWNEVQEADAKPAKKRAEYVMGGQTAWKTMYKEAEERIKELEFQNKSLRAEVKELKGILRGMKVMV